MNPLISNFLMDDIQVVIEQAVYWANAGYYTNPSDELCFSSLLTLLKCLDDDSPLRLDIETIAAKMFVNGGQTCLMNRLMLGPKHPFVLSMEINTSKERLKLCDNLMQVQLKFDRKLYSLCGIDSTLTFEKITLFLAIYTPTHFLYATVDVEEIQWNAAIVAQSIFFHNLPPDKFPKQERLFIIGMLRPPTAFCNKVTSFKNLGKFYEWLKTSSVRRMILAYGITILESSSRFGIN